MQKVLARTSVLACPGWLPEARVLAPPHSTSARSYDNLHYRDHDLVAISMGTGGWVFEMMLGQTLLMSA